MMNTIKFDLFEGLRFGFRVKATYECRLELHSVGCNGEFNQHYEGRYVGHFQVFAYLLRVIFRV